MLFGMERYISLQIKYVAFNVDAARRVPMALRSLTEKSSLGRWRTVFPNLVSFKMGGPLSQSLHMFKLPRWRNAGLPNV